MRHTPGPWRIAFFGSHVETSDGEPIAKVAGIRGMKMAQRANANLIAAAPDLLEALEMLAAVDFGADGSVERGARLARIAIAKATGDQHAN